MRLNLSGQYYHKIASYDEDIHQRRVPKID